MRTSLCLSFPFLIAASGASAAPEPRAVILEQLVAVKDVCAWPKLALTPKGEVIAAIYNRPTHGAQPGDVEIHASTDGGRTWAKRGTATRHAGETARFNHAVGVNRRGEILVVSGGWSYQSPDAKGATKKKKLLRPTASRSIDGGRTWTISEKFPDGADGMTLVPFGNIETGADGALRVAAYSYNTTVSPRVDVCYTAVSLDHGASWTLGSVVGRPAANETDVLHLGAGKWLAAARNLGRTGERGHSTDIYVSEDDAKSWHLLATPTVGNQHPADLLRLADGRVLLTYGDRRGPKFGVDGCISADGGKTWSAPLQLANGFASRDSGYPSSVQLADGTIVTGYYASKSTLYDGYQMGVVRWRLAEGPAP
ncbi:MAG: exo-alpha-sialidase [Opitutus sp.]|nr:exo-alpha-sialidase [Opitutus sp.]